MGILDKINSPADLKKLDEEKLPELCEELREFVVDNVSKTGGHLASNLGIVELTVAIHRVFDTSRDRLVFDVGHQSYIHKIITGRKNEFNTLRTYGGISGFPKPKESIHDAFIAGHASAAISQALGMARARTLMGDDYNVIALLGDGALTGGLAYEALCDAGASRERLIVILNDNGMSISRNVGGMSKHLARLRLGRSYRSFKNFYRKAAKRIPGGGVIYRTTHRIKSAIKNMLLKCSMFEDIGFTYLGPVDGHDTKQLINALKIARDVGGPVLLHTITKKGKGYYFAEKYPELFHGVSPFDATTGVVPLSGDSFSSVFGEELVKLAADNEKIIAITAAMTPGTGLTGFAEKYKSRFFDVGIAEEHATAMAAGAAHQGAVPVLALYSTFLQRAYDMLIHDIGIGKEHVVLAVDKAGLVGEDGETHHGAFDVGYLRSVPGMTVLSPSSFNELRDMLRLAVDFKDGPIAVRYPKGGEGEYKGGGTQMSKLLHEGEDFTVVTYGITINAVLEAAKILEEDGIGVDVLKLSYIKPYDYDAILASVKKTGRLMVVEECTSYCCVGGDIAAQLTADGQSPRRLILRNLGDNFVTHGAVGKLREVYGLDGKSIAKEIAQNVPRRKRD